MSQEEQQVCGVCLDSTELIRMPCCGRDEATTRFCLVCIQMICELAPESDGRGRCPKCREEIMIADGAVVVAPKNVGRCRMCCQPGKTLVESNTCDACALGSRHPLRYECDRCGRTQRIPHPMWRYQPTPDRHGSATWACHQRCGDYTHWRCIPEDLASVPSWDRPQAWGLEDEVVSRVRARRQAERRGEPPPQTPPSGSAARRASGSNGGCIVA